MYHKPVSISFVPCLVGLNGSFRKFCSHMVLALLSDMGYYIIMKNLESSDLAIVSLYL